MGDITEGSKFSSDRKGGGVIMHPLLLPTMIENCEDDNGNDDWNMYKNGDISNHDHHAEDRSLAGTSAYEGKYPMFVGGLDGQILDVDECGTHDDGYDDEDTNKSNVLFLGLPRNYTTGMSLINLAADRPPYTDTK